jgi:hypothetical protein
MSIAGEHSPCDGKVVIQGVNRLDLVNESNGS